MARSPIPALRQHLEVWEVVRTLHLSPVVFESGETMGHLTKQFSFSVKPEVK